MSVNTCTSSFIHDGYDNSLSTLEIANFSGGNKFYGIMYKEIGISLYQINCKEHLYRILHVNTPWFPHIHEEKERKERKDTCGALVKCL
jgi:hypothetical protein